jgi:hypothetical protein
MTFAEILMNGRPRRVRHARIVRGSTPMNAAADSSVSSESAVIFFKVASVIDDSNVAKKMRNVKVSSLFQATYG